jgi:putative hydrolase of the HAD superfamily
MKNAVHVFCFDLDDTLFSEADYVESGLLAAGALVDAEAPSAEPAGDWLVALWRRERARDAFQQLLRRRELHPEVWLPRLKDAYRAHLPRIRPRAGVAEALAALRDGGASLALVSDGLLDVQRRKWSALGFSRDFHPVVFTDERGRDHWKPHPWAFECVMQAHPAASRFLYVGDNPAKDFIAPNRLGWTTVMVRDDRNLHAAACATGDAAPHVTVESLGSLVELWSRDRGSYLRAGW